MFFLMPARQSLISKDVVLEQDVVLVYECSDQAPLTRRQTGLHEIVSATYRNQVPECVPHARRQRPRNHSICVVSTKAARPDVAATEGFYRLFEAGLILKRRLQLLGFVIQRWWAELVKHCRFHCGFRIGLLIVRHLQGSS